MKHDAQILKQFENDLRGMSEQEVQNAYDEITQKIDEDTEWQEALAARLRQIDGKSI